MRPAEVEGGAREARDVMAFGQEIGRVLSDGRVVGRAEPFAKVFPSSRAVKRAVGLVAWAILEDIALDARLDDLGRLVSETNVRRIAANLGISKNTVTHHLGTLREYGFVLREELRDGASGRYEVSRYVLDPSACIERFTVTPRGPEGGPGGERGPAREEREASVGVAAHEGSVRPPCPKNGDAGSVSQVTGPGELGQLCRDVDVVQEDQQARGDQQARASVGGDGLAGQLAELGVAGHVVADLLDRYPAARVCDAAVVAAGRRLRNPAAWLVAALRDNWDLTRPAAEIRAGQAQRALAVEQAAVADRRHVGDAAADVRAAGWAAALSGALDDRQLARAIAQVTEPLPGLGRRSLPVVRAQLIGWAVDAAGQRQDLPLPDALAQALSGAARPVEQPPLDELPDPPEAAAGADLDERIRVSLARETFPPEPSKEQVHEPDARAVAR